MIETSRLLITEATTKDRSFIYELLNSSTWLNHIGDRGIHTLRDAEDYIENSLIHSYKTFGHGLLTVSIADTSSPIGICGLLKRDYLGYPDLGFAILPIYEGRGYMHEAATAVLEDAKQRLHLSTVAAITSQENLRSIKLLDHLGFSLKDDRAQDNDGKSFLHYSLDL